MIAETIKILRSDDFYGVSKEVESAKGKREIVYTFKEASNKIKRLWQSRKY
jgi:hypothetical protein